MENRIMVSLDRILWKWWLGKDYDHQEAFNDLLYVIAVNREDLTISPWYSNMTQEYAFKISQKEQTLLQELEPTLSISVIANSCLKNFRAEEEKMKTFFS